MYTLIAFATQWGSKHGGINSFNADFLSKFGAAYHHGSQIICVVTDHSPKATEEAANSQVRLIALPYIPRERWFDSSIGELCVDLLKKAGISFESEKTIWLGHDLITGEAAIGAAKAGGGRSAVIHHMSYSDYESYAEDSESALNKTEKQTAILRAADLVLAIGPLLRDAASDRVGSSNPVHMVVPGLPEIDSREAPKTFVAFLSGRLTADAARIKQGHLGIAAFAAAESKAHVDGGPEPLKRQPKLLLRGVDFENRVSDAPVNTARDPETELKDFTEEYAKGVINLHVLPYTENREQLYSELSGASVAFMPSWHEGFGLVAWEAIAAGVPLILGENTGVYRLLDEELFGAQKGYIYPLDVRGQNEFPYFRPEDLEATVTALKSVAANPANARNRAGMLRNMLLEKYTWTNCCENVAKAFNWNLQTGIVADRTSEIVKEGIEQGPTTASLTPAQLGPLRIPRGRWRAGAGMADSQLLRAEEELLPFDIRRQPEVEKLTEWATHTGEPIAIRLITGDGGQGKTRLGIHVCQLLRPIGWHSGFLDSTLEANQMPILWRDLNALKQPVFVVIDYAETRQQAFLALLKAALQNKSAKPVRILLLARDGGEWWDNLPSKDSYCEGLLSGQATTGPFRIAPLYSDEDDRVQAFNSALHAFADLLEVVDRCAIVPDLTSEQFERPLYIQMAALLALYGERPTTAQGLTKALLNHERRYWMGLLSSFGWPDPARRAEQLLALATLSGGFATTRIGEKFWTAAKGTILTTGEFNSLFRTLATIYPGTEGLQPLKPDLLGEALVAQALLRPEGDALLDAVLSSSASQHVRRNALTVVARMLNERTDVNETIVAGVSRRFENCGADLVAVSTETMSRLPELAESAFERLSAAIKRQVAGTLTQSLPAESVQLAGLSRLVYEYLVAKAREKFEKKPENLDRIYDYASALNNYGLALTDVGLYEEACRIADSALLMARRLVTKDRKRYETVYANLVGTYATSLRKAGRYEAVLPYDRESIQIYRRLAKENPDAFELDYARALGNYAIHLAIVGQHQEALQQTEIALGIHRKWLAKNPDRYEASYVNSLNNYASDLSNIGQSEQALGHSRTVLEIYERLAQKNPDRYEPDYARALSNYAKYLAEVSRITDSVHYARHGMEIRRRLAIKQPKRFGSDLLANIYFVSFLCWLSDDEYNVNDDSLETIRSTIPIHERPLLRFFSTFVQGCSAKDLPLRKKSLVAISDIWSNLSPADKVRGIPYRLCAAAWCDKFAPPADTAWQAEWNVFWTNRNGNLPRWMFEVARRLDFEFR